MLRVSPRHLAGLGIHGFSASVLRGHKGVTASVISCLVTLSGTRNPQEFKEKNIVRNPSSSPVLGIEPRTWCVRGKRPPTELCPQPLPHPSPFSGCR